MSAKGQGDARPILTDHLVAYMDLLGFRSVVAAPTDNVQTLIYTALSEFKAAEQNFEIKIEPTGEGQRTTYVKPGISAFSDHMVMSFDLAEMHGSAVGIYQGLMSILSVAQAVAHRAREFDCLLRGAVTVGPLCHKEGIIFGQGLVSAYEMETKKAINPRIIIDKIALLGVTAGANSEMALFQDKDGFWCLDYMTAYLDYLDSQTGRDRTETGCAVRRSWALGTRARALDMAAKLENDKEAIAAGYWRWFAGRFETSMRSVNQHYFSTDGTPIQFPE